MLVKDQSARFAAALSDFSCDSCEVVGVASFTDDLLAAVERYRPDVVIADMDAPNRDMLEALGSVQARAPHPLVLFSPDDDPANIKRAVRAGVSAYVADDLQRQRIRPILDAAIAHFEQYRALQAELERTRNALAERKTIDRAKGIIMTQRGVTEPEAYRLLRKAAMDRNQRLVQVAESIIAASEILGGPSRTT